MESRYVWKESAKENTVRGGERVRGLVAHRARAQAQAPTPTALHQIHFLKR